MELSDNSLFVSMAIPDSKIFIVTPAKELLWNAVAEKYNPTTKQWECLNIYGASIIPSRKELEKLIWNAAVE